MTNDKKNNKLIAEALNDCFERILAGNDSVESCLESYPQYAHELKPLLETMRAAKAASNLFPDASFRARARYEFQSVLSDSMLAKKRRALSWQWRWATAASTAAVFLLASTGSIVAASSNSMPGQALYQVKRDIEEVQITLSPSQVAKARLYASLADRRVSEIVYTAQLGDAQTTENLTQQFTQDLNMVSALATPSRALTYGSGSKQAGSPSVAGSSTEPIDTNTGTITATTPPALAPTIIAPPTITVVPTTTMAVAPPVTVVNPPAITLSIPPVPTIVIPSNPPTVIITVPSVSAPVLTITQPSYTLVPPTTLSGITDPALLKLLQQYSVKNVAELMSILDKVSPYVKAALLAAIQAATSGYGQILGS